MKIKKERAYRLFLLLFVVLFVSACSADAVDPIDPTSDEFSHITSTTTVLTTVQAIPTETSTTITNEIQAVTLTPLSTMIPMKEATPVVEATSTVVATPALTDASLMVETTQIADGIPLVMAVEIMATGEIFFFNLEGTISHSMKVDRGEIVNWDNNSCLIQVKAYLDSKTIAIGLTDLEGNILLKTALQFEDVSSVQGLMISPTHEWVSYTVLSGQRGLLEAEYQDVEVASLEKGSVIYRLTERSGGGAGQAAWSSDGQRISFTDFDEHGNIQYFYAKPDGGDRVQVTNFSNTHDFRPRISAWSPDGTLLALVGPRQSDGLPSVWIAYTDGSLYATDIPVSNYVQIRPPFWWDENNILLVASENENYDSDLVWIDGSNDEILHSLNEQNLPFMAYNNPILLNGTNEIAFHEGSGDYYRYDRYSGEVEHLFDIRSQLDDPIFRAIYSPTNGPINIVNCQ